MFCNKCGTELSEGALFCRKCGAKVKIEGNVNDISEAVSNGDATLTIHHHTNASATEDETMEDKLYAILADVGPNLIKIEVVQMIQEWTGLEPIEASKLVSKTPVLLNRAITQEEAEAIKAVFTKCGATVYFVDQEGNNVDISVHCKACGTVLDDGSIICKSCGRVLDIRPPYKTEIQQEGLSFLDGGSRKSLFSELGTKLRKMIDLFKGLEPVLKVIIALSALVLANYVILIVSGIFRVVFSSIIAVLAVTAGGYIIYHRWVAKYFTEYTYDAKSKKLQLPAGMSAQTLLEALDGKFNYPYFKGVQYNEKGQCVIRGRYSFYTVVFDEKNVAYITCHRFRQDKRYREILLEATVICNYINKFFNPTMQTNAIKDFEKLKAIENHRKIATILSFLIVALIIWKLAWAMGLQWYIEPGMEVRGACLSQYSEKVTIEEAFENFFDNGKWSEHETESYSYVVFTGACQYQGERVDVRIIFKITGNNFIVDSLDINGQTQNDFTLRLLLLEVYENY